MSIPSIKGLAFSSIVSDVNQLVEEGRIAADALEAQLESEDLRILGEKIEAGAWYPTATYGRLGAVLDRVEGKGRPEYFIDRGAKAAERLFAAGLYSQLKWIDERAPEIEEESSLSRLDIKLTLSMWNAMFNCTTWVYEPDADDPNKFTCIVNGATDFPEVLQLAAQGFLQYGFTRLANSRVSVSSDRPNDEQIVYSFVVTRSD